MTLNTLEQPRSMPRRHWWYAAVVILAGIVVAVVAYDNVTEIVWPGWADEGLRLDQPWRIAIQNLAYYAPISLAQGLVIRRLVPNAWWWIVATLGSVVTVQPLMIWAFWTWNAYFLEFVVFLIWFFGLASGMFTHTSQWLVLRRWTRRSWAWLLAVPCVWVGILLLAHVPDLLFWLQHRELSWWEVSLTGPSSAYNEYVFWFYLALYQELISYLLLFMLTRWRKVSAVAGD
jgi:hypothetical protein